MSKISWWRTSFGAEEISKITESIQNECVSQGRVTVEFEQRLSEYLEVEHVVTVSSGSTALLLAAMAIGIKYEDEVIVTNRTWIATAHAIHLIGGKVVLVDVEADRPIIDSSLIEQAITPRTKAIIPVHMNGRSADMKAINRIAKKHKLYVIEDAAQAIGSCNRNGQLGTQSDIGCFSLSVAKTIATGQGGFAVTNNAELASRMRSLRTHGVGDVKEFDKWSMPGFNFRFTDVLASIGIEQLKRLPERIKHLKELYNMYDEGLKDTKFRIIPVNLDQGEVPVYNEFLVENRGALIKRLERADIQALPFVPNLDKAHYLPQIKYNFPNSIKYGINGITLPSGPTQKKVDVEFVINRIKCMKN
jgi:perosamine synthetase